MNSTDEFCPAAADSLIHFYSTPATCVVTVLTLILLLISTSCKNGEKQNRCDVHDNINDSSVKIQHVTTDLDSLSIGTSGHSFKSWMQNLENSKLLSKNSWSSPPPLLTDSSLLWPSKFNPVLSFPKHKNQMSRDIVSITADLSLDDHTNIIQFSDQNLTSFKPTNCFSQPINYNTNDQFMDDFMEWEDESGVVNGYHDNININDMINKKISNTKNKSFIYPLVIIIVIVLIIVIIFYSLYTVL